MSQVIDFSNYKPKQATPQHNVPIPLTPPSQMDTTNTRHHLESVNGEKILFSIREVANSLQSEYETRLSAICLKTFNHCKTNKRQQNGIN